MPSAESLTVLGTAADGDLIIVVDVSATTGTLAARRMTLSELATYVNGHSTNGGGGGTTQSHTIYVAYGATQAQTAATAADFTASGRSVNNSADTSSSTLTTPSLTSGQYRHYFIAVPSDRRITEVYIGSNPINQFSAFTLAATGQTPDTLTIGGAAHVVYAGNQPVNNSGLAYRIVTEAA